MYHWDYNIKLIFAPLSWIESDMSCYTMLTIVISIHNEEKV